MSPSSPPLGIGTPQLRGPDPGVQHPPEGEASDSELIEAVRSGDTNATATLYTRHYDSALRVARGVAGSGNAEDLASEAFTKVLAAMLRGAGPVESFRPYLASTVRNLYVDGVRKSARELLVGDPDILDHAEPDGTDAFVEQSIMIDVLASLPPRWREILWRTVVLGEPLRVAAAKMGLNANAAAALNFRARGGLTKAYERAASQPLARGGQVRQHPVQHVV